MATKTYVFNGTAKWAKVRSPDPEYKNYTLDLYMNADELAKFKKSGIRTALKDGEDGKFTTFKRNDEQLINGEVKVHGAPDVYLRDAQSGEYNLWKSGLIGNGSRVAVTVDAFDTDNGIGHRLQRVFIDDLVPYEGRDKDAPPPETAKLPF